MNCRNCGNEYMDYVGVDDGFGMTGNLCCDVWECHQCGAMDADNCFNCEDDEQFGSHEHQLEEANERNRE